jgi:hypothetical protein
MMRVAALLAALAVSTWSCRSEPSVSSTPRETLPAAPTTDVTAQPVPPLPADISPVIYGVGELAAMGNVQATLRGSARDETNVTVELDVVNAALEPVMMRAESFRLYLEDGTSLTPIAELDSPLTASPFASGEQRRVALRFAIGDTAEVVMVVFDGAAYGDRVSSAAFVLDED